MRFIYIILLLILTFGCSSNNNASEFEKVLGKENNATLTLLVNDFENDFLKKQYPNSELNESYKKFLIDYKNGSLENWVPLPKKITESFNSSQLEKEMYYHPDSVWILPNSSFDKIEEDSLIFLDVNRPYIKLRKKNLMFSSPEKTIYEYDRHYIKIDSTTDKDSLINKIMNVKYVNHYNGKYIQTTNYIRKFGGFFERFSDQKGIIDKKQFCDLVLKEADLNDELIRKLIVLELVL
ncbi:hypothetical protein [Winogradskyella arenosi]|uniref:Lipoprotein n=1 Tax=Winogradskyella arenosi TaxID=533325 RepID=A0A368ZAK9_9FLAO|nr:hypothetical protein [Winogradskyella arenosi]RCW89823.1 hypothetical protein DFQ08_1073 [Winogradskyella arenosi]